MTAVGSDSQEFFVLTETLSVKTVFEVPEKGDHSEKGRGCTVYGPKPPSQKIRLTPESFVKCEALCYRGGAKQLLTGVLEAIKAMMKQRNVRIAIQHDFFLGHSAAARTVNANKAWGAGMSECEV
ncbi:hypothetical protein TNCV_190741 [Trichonephila clavipes]|nr:hypothetical protein TNCV_190741 [Trichonephila clavipes]